MTNESTAKAFAAGAKESSRALNNRCPYPKGSEERAAYQRGFVGAALELAPVVESEAESAVSEGEPIALPGHDVSQGFGEIPMSPAEGVTWDEGEAEGDSVPSEGAEQVDERDTAAGEEAVTP